MIFAEISPTSSLIAVVVGVGCELIAVLNDHFYWGRGYGGRPAPTWVGRLMFGFVGFVFIVIGMRGLFFTD